MFVSAQVHQAVRLELATERGRREILERDAASRQAFVDFLCARVNQLEVERAVLLKAATKIDMPVPIIAAPSTTAAPPIGEALDGPADIFSDMGDAAALRHGVRWGDGGAVEYAREPAGTT